MGGDPNRARLRKNELYGILQFSCGLPTPELLKPDVLTESRAVTVGDVWERRRGLRSWLLPPGQDFDLHGLTDVFGAVSEGADFGLPHTWLMHLSRHAAMKPADYSSRCTGESAAAGFPVALDWHRPAAGGEPPWTHYLRVQRARDDSNRFTKETDCNDYLIRSPDLAPGGSRRPEPGSLWELQLFFCELIGLRRGAVFASHVSERIYNVWLPPGVITRGEADAGDRWGHDGCFAVLPVVTIVRRPYRIDWRYAMSLTVLLVPWSADQAERPLPRSMSSQEIYEIAASTRGNSTYLRAPGGCQWALEDSPLLTYLRAIVADWRRDFCHRYAAPAAPSGWGSQTLRHWIELLLMTVAEVPRGQDEREDDRLRPEQQQADDRLLPDEVLRCLRVNGLWFATLVTDQFDSCSGDSPLTFAACGGDQALASGCWWPSGMRAFPEKVSHLTMGMPAAVGQIFAEFAERERGFPPTPADRVDVLPSGGKAHMTWRVPRENVIVTVYDRSADEFPSFSSLYLVGWFACMAVGVTCAWQTMYSLTHDTDRLRDVAELSQLGHDRIMDLEDLYEFDVAWSAYADFYRRLRNLLGVDREYDQIKDRLNLLFRFAEAEQRTQEERLRDEEIRLGSEEQRLALTHSHTVENVAAVVAALILFVSILSLLVAVHGAKQIMLKTAVVSNLAIVSAGFLIFTWLRLRVRKIDNAREAIRAALERHARRPGQPPRRTRS